MYAQPGLHQRLKRTCLYLLPEAAADAAPRLAVVCPDRRNEHDVRQVAMVSRFQKREIVHVHQKVNLRSLVALLWWQHLRLDDERGRSRSRRLHRHRKAAINVGCTE